MNTLDTRNIGGYRETYTVPKNFSMKDGKNVRLLTEMGMSGGCGDEHGREGN